MTTFEAPKTTPKEVTTADVLERAIDLIGEFGWAQGVCVAHRKPGPFCLGTAIHEARRDLGITAPITGVYSQLLGLRLGANVGWNDTPGRTKSEVVSLLRQAAERSRETA